MNVAEAKRFCWIALMRGHGQPAQFRASEVEQRRAGRRMPQSGSDEVAVIPSPVLTKQNEDQSSRLHETFPAANAAATIKCLTLKCTRAGNYSEQGTSLAI